MFTFDSMVEDLKQAARQDDALTAVRAVLERSIAEPDAILSATDPEEEDEVLLHEDEHVSIWRCRFQPYEIMPPHEHKMPVVIATYGGVERSLIFQRSVAGLEQTGTVDIAEGQVRALPEDAIHAVVGANGVPSDAIHVYLGPLGQITRDLYDWESGKAVPFTMEAFEAMKRPNPG